MTSGLPIKKRTIFGASSPVSLRRIAPRSNLHEHHQTCPSHPSPARAFLFTASFCALGCLHELDHIRMPDRRFDRRNDLLKWFRRCHTEPFYLDFSDRHVVLRL